METLIKYMPADMLRLLLPILAMKVGSYFKNKDADNVGADDAFGNFLIAGAPVLSAIGEGQESAFKKSLTALYDWIGNYMGFPPRHP